ncbi:hypothetical protein OUZ56_029954 [Daphnia magna]|uniref:Uncharacterized protein n=1 Tax=Daphnia magna TaxID=35525 RepID=A0ABR0B8D0_9CRUS|nr:hypothetical protein OUZ56_029954 [Daphnia magna]
MKNAHKKCQNNRRIQSFLTWAFTATGVLRGRVVDQHASQQTSERRVRKHRGLWHYERHYQQG